MSKWKTVTKEEWGEGLVGSVISYGANATSLYYAKRFDGETLYCGNIDDDTCDMPWTFISGEFRVFVPDFDSKVSMVPDHGETTQHASEFFIMDDSALVYKQGELSIIEKGSLVKLQKVN